ncbi:GNAT family N-acetyltransferase [Actinotalea ferrariae]|uniref:GNAT family N-acetyltransferase n=1 Tax=Actinotalea ferrariae TaxID=1386098 RepID=UPI001C8CD422|nr:GNAT family N-acetyltransferase [Actinotalea ferrariae]MBX9245489.1 GNAT family N-acetyltransferase [Actinotalea ferrariae]
MLLGDRVRWQRVEVATSPGDVAVLVAVLREQRTTLLARGDASAAVALVEERVARLRAEGRPTAVGWMSVPRGAAVDDALLGTLGLARYSSWDWMATDVEPPDVRAEDEVVRIDPVAESVEVRACLAEANPGTTADPTASDQAAWFGVRDGDRLLGVAGVSLRGGPGDDAWSWHLHGLGVRPEARGRGLGKALTAAATRAGLRAGAAWVSLGMYADNDRARRIYERLGYVTEGEFASYGPPGARRPPT